MYAGDKQSYMSTHKDDKGSVEGEKITNKDRRNKKINKVDRSRI